MDLETQSAASPRSPMWSILTGVLVLCAAVYGLYRYGSYLDGATTENAQALTFLILVGLALVIALMAGLGIVYSMLGVADHRQALALPEGSIRALIAFSLLLIFVCMATFVYKGARDATLVEVGQLKRVNAQQVPNLEKTFSGAAEPVRNDDGTAVTEPGQGGGQPQPLYNITYYAERGRDANDIGKQIFTTLATVFVSVVSFYFGSSTTASAVGAGMKAASGEGPQGATSGTKGASQTPPQAVDPHRTP